MADSTPTNGNNLPSADFPTAAEALRELPGSSPLRNSRHEIVAQGLADGLPLADAWFRAGYKPDRRKSAQQAASLCKKRPDVKARIAFLKKLVDVALQNRKTLVIKELESIALTKVNDVMEWDEDGKTKLKASDQIPDEALAAIKSVSKHSGGVKVVLHDKLDGLRQLREVHGLRQDQPRAGVTVVIVSPQKAETATEWQEKYSKGREIPVSLPSAEEDVTKP